MGKDSDCQLLRVSLNEIKLVTENIVVLAAILDLSVTENPNELNNMKNEFSDPENIGIDTNIMPLRASTAEI